MNFLLSIRARLLLVSLLLLLIPFIGFRFVKQMEGFLREGQHKTVESAARLLSATLSDRPQLLKRDLERTSQDELERQRVVGMFGSDTPETAASLGAAYFPSEDIDRILDVVSKNTSRIWVVDTKMRVRGLSGGLAGSSNVADRVKVTPDATQKFYQFMVRPLLKVLGADSSYAMVEDATNTQQAVMAQADRALSGQATKPSRYLKDARTEVLMAAQPIWVGDEIVGAVVVEETTRDNQLITTTALESLLATSLIVFFVGFLTLVVFAWRLAYRVRRLQTEAALAIDSQGRITGTMSGSGARDEVGALARTLEDVLQRLGRYNGYLEQLASRLAHELRTPVTVVRSSLDNLRHADSQTDAKIYIERADEGVRRLSLLIARMSEATQLESMLQGAEKERFDLVKVIAGCVEGYRLAYPLNQFIFNATHDRIELDGLPDTMAQLLDKLVQNAIDFTPSHAPIIISIMAFEKYSKLSVQNQGPTVAPEILAGLFNSMVTARTESFSKGAHLGLGLYIVRLIAEFHLGSVLAMNLNDKSGVRMEVTLPRH